MRERNGEGEGGEKRRAKHDVRGANLRVNMPICEMNLILIFTASEPSERGMFTRKIASCSACWKSSVELG